MVEEVLSFLEWGVLPTPAPHLSETARPAPRNLEPHLSTRSLHWQAARGGSGLTPQRYRPRGYFCTMSGGLVRRWAEDP